MNVLVLPLLSLELAIVSVVARSKETKIHYTNWLSDFLHYLNTSCDGLFNFGANQLQQEIISM
jgi:hypothetical protein